MSSMQMAEAIQQDWENRDYIEKISLSILKISEFLNKFEVATRTRLSTLNEKLTSLERKMEYIESQVLSIQGDQQQQQ